MPDSVVKCYPRTDNSTEGSLQILHKENQERDSRRGNRRSGRKMLNVTLRLIIRQKVLYRFCTRRTRRDSRRGKQEKREKTSAKPQLTKGRLNQPREAFFTIPMLFDISKALRPNNKKKKTAALRYEPTDFTLYIYLLVRHAVLIMAVFH